jgi:hypothetical protein
MSSAIAKQPHPLDDADAPPILRGDDDSVRMVEAALSTDDRLAAHSATGDLVEHELTFERFLSLLVVAVLHVVTCLIALAIGGVEGHWGPAVIFVALATAAVVPGASVPTIGWKPGAVILAIEVLAWFVLA